MYQNRKISFVTDAYTAKFYENSGINILYQPISYVLDNFRELEQLFDIFSSLSIEVNDVKRDNLVMDTNKIVLIDPDCFVLSGSMAQFVDAKKIEDYVNGDIVTSPTSVRIATAGNYSGMIGAALLALNKENH